MTRLTDGKKTVNITMTMWKDGQYTPDCSACFFEIGELLFDKEKNAYCVSDVDICVSHAVDWTNQTDDPASGGKETGYRSVCVTSDRR